MRYLNLIALLLIGCGCKKYTDKPEVWFTLSPNEGDSLKEWIVPIAWNGNKYTIEFRLIIDGMGREWTEEKSETLYLDDGTHRVSLIGRNILHEVSDTVATTFVVNNIEGPSLFFTPRYAMLTPDSSYHLTLNCKEIDNGIMGKIILRWKRSMFSIKDIKFYIDSVYWLKRDSAGFLEVDFGKIEGSIMGEAQILDIVFNIHSKGRDTLSLYGSELRDLRDSIIHLNIYNPIVEVR